MFAQIIAVSARTRAASERIFEILDSNPVVTERPGARDLDVPVRWWSARCPRLPGVGAGAAGLLLLVAPGETVALVGASGSGKSTVSMLLRFYDVQQGTIRIDGIDVRDVTLDSLRREVGVVFEDSFLFSDTVRNNMSRTGDLTPPMPTS